MQQFTTLVPRTPSRHVQALVATEPSTPRLNASERMAIVQTEIHRSAQSSYPLYQRFLELPSSLSHFDKLRELVPGTHVDDTSWGHLGLDDLFLRTGARVCGQLAEHHGEHSFTPAAMVAWRLYRQPSPTGDVWVEKQGALKAVLADSQLHEQLKSLVTKLHAAKAHCVLVEPGEYFASRWYSEAVESMRTVSAACKDLEASGSPYIDAILSTLKSATSQGFFELCTKGISFSPRGIVPLDRGDFWRYVRPFAPFRHDLGKVVATIGSCIVTASLVTATFSHLDSKVGDGWALLGAFLSLLSFGSSLVGYHDLVFGDPAKKIVDPLHALAKKDEQLGRFFEAQGRLEELLGWADFASSSKLPVTFPRRLEGEREFKLHARRLGSYQFAESDPDYVLNDISIDAGKVHMLTGANHSGKTNLKVNIAQGVISSDIAGITLGGEFNYTAGTRVVFHTPTKDEGESRLDKEGGDLMRASAHASNHTGPVFWPMDEITSSTGEREGAEVATRFIMSRYCLPQRPCMLIGTHNRGLVEKLERAGIAALHKMEWQDGKPTYKIIDGVEYDSHADAVFAKHGGDMESLRNQVIAQGGSVERFDQLIALAERG